MSDQINKRFLEAKKPLDLSQEEKDTLLDLEQQGYKAYIATVECQYIVVAKDEEEAQDVASNAHKEEYYYGSDFDIGSFSYTPGGWEDNSLVWNNTNMDVSVRIALHLPGGYKFQEEKSDPNQQELFPKD